MMRAWRAMACIVVLGVAGGAGVAASCTSDADCNLGFGTKCHPGPSYCDVNGTCTSPNALSCDDGDVCTDDSCQEGAPGNGCVHAPHCPSTGSVCQGGGQCVPFQLLPNLVIPDCLPAVPLDCDDGNACTFDSCVDPTGCMHVPVNCDDGDLSTRDVCDVQLGCLHFPITSSLPGCKTAADCPDDACTTGRACVSGACTTGQPRSCDDGDPCTVDTCDLRGGCGHARISGCCRSDADCTPNADPCTVVTCNPDRTCGVQAKVGIEALTCACGRSMPDACDGQPVPVDVTRRLQHACGLLAKVHGSAADRKLVTQAAGLFGRAAHTLGVRDAGSVAAACVSNLRALIGDDHGRAQAFLDQL